VTSDEWMQVIEYDKRITDGSPREKWLKLWMLEHPKGFGRISFDENGCVNGYGHIHDGSKYYFTSS
jgi:hypothetical protein